MKRIKMMLSGLLFVSFIAKAQQPPPPPPSPEVRLKQVSTKLEKELTLNAAQKQKVEEAFKTFFAGIEQLRKDNPPPPPPPPGKKEDIDKLAKARDEQIKAALTASQFKKYVEVEKTLRPKHPHGPPPPAPK